METYEIKQKGEVSYLSIPALEKIPFLVHGFSTRLGGVSTGIYQTMNLGFMNGDIKENVLENYRRIDEAIGFDRNTLVFPMQTHTTNIRIVTKEDIGKGYSIERDYSNVDALITNQDGITLTVFTADCVPVFLIDFKRKVIATVHAGWKGTAQKIVKKTVNLMKQEFHTAPCDLIAAIGPSICNSCYEVSADVANVFKDNFSEEYQSLILTKIEKKEDEKYLLNLQLCNRITLEEENIPSNQIFDCGLCTNCHPKLLFSHRATAGKRGIMAGFLKIKEQIDA